MTDPSIRAVMPMAPDGMRLFEERGLAAADRAVLIIAGGDDELYPEDVLIHQALGTADKAMISFSGKGHMMIFEAGMVARMQHFATAFLGTNCRAGKIWPGTTHRIL